MKKKDRVSHSYVVGIISLVFLIIGYQTALFVHKAAVAKIVSNRDHPDTVYVMDREMADSLLDSGPLPDGAGESGRASGGTVSGSSTVDGAEGNVSGRAFVTAGKIDKASSDRSRVVVKKEADHCPEARKLAASKREVREFRFDPNTVSVEELQLLGFTLKQARSIDNYRKKGGRFRRKSDFAKSFVVSDEIYSRLEPFIDIPLLDLNLADSAAFDALPGIGGYFAAKMVSFREALGGYSYKEQLMDIYNFSEDKFDALKDLITVAPENIRPYPLWTLPEDSLKLHPYIGSHSAHGIIIFRENNPTGNWTVRELSSAGILKPDFAEKLSRCVIEPVRL